MRPIYNTQKSIVQKINRSQITYPVHFTWKGRHLRVREMGQSKPRSLKSPTQYHTTNSLMTYLAVHPSPTAILAVSLNMHVQWDCCLIWTTTIASKIHSYVQKMCFVFRVSGKHRVDEPEARIASLLEKATVWSYVFSIALSRWYVSRKA